MRGFGQALLLEPRHPAGINCDHYYFDVSASTLLLSMLMAITRSGAIGRLRWARELPQNNNGTQTAGS
jgi:hypothetical protein